MGKPFRIAIGLGIMAAATGVMIRLLSFPSSRPVPDVAGRYLAYTVDYPPVYDVRGFDFVLRLEVFRPFDGEGKAFVFRRPDGLYRLAWLRDKKVVSLIRNEKPLIDVSVLPILGQARAFLKGHPEAKPSRLPQEVLTLQAENDSARVRLVFDDISARESREQVDLYHFKADVFVGASRLASGSPAPKKRVETVSNR